MKKSVVTLFGDYYHDHDLIEEAFSRAVAPFADRLEVSDTGAGQLPGLVSDGPALVVINKENRIDPQSPQPRLWMTPALEKELCDYVKAGGALLAWHAALASYPEDGEYVSMLRGTFRFHPRINKPVSYYTKGDGGLGGLPLQFEAVDEHYFVECDLVKTEAFLFSESVDGASTAGWSHYFGEGRVLCLTPAHRREGLENPSMLKLLGEAVRWCCKL